MRTFTAAMIAEGQWELAGYDVASMDEDQVRDLFIEANQHLIDTGAAWELQGHFGRQALALIERGECFLPIEVV